MSHPKPTSREAYDALNAAPASCKAVEKLRRHQIYRQAFWRYGKEEALRKAKLKIEDVDSELLWELHVSAMRKPVPWNTDPAGNQIRKHVAAAQREVYLLCKRRDTPALIVKHADVIAKRLSAILSCLKCS